METQWLTFGYIPSDFLKSPTICRDADESGIREFSLFTYDEKIAAIESLVKITIDHSGFFDQTLKLYGKLLRYFSQIFLPKDCYGFNIKRY